MQLHGSILPEMILPLLFVGVWATAVRCFSEYVHNIGVNQVLLTVLGFVVGLGLSFRSSTAYERYNEGRKYWAQVSLASNNLARTIWVNASVRSGESAKQDMLHKITGLNLIVAYSIALKHKLRWEPYTNYDDLEGLISHLNTWAQEATATQGEQRRSRSHFKAVGEYLGVSFAHSNPMKAVKKSTRPLGNLPLEILSYISAYLDDLADNAQLKIPHQTFAVNNIASLNDALIGTDRILRTPLPIAYSIAIAQITWVYIFMLPFQLESTLKWVMIPATIVAAYIILGILFIGREIENPFGDDVNDLPLDSYCQRIANDIDVICSIEKPKIADLVKSPKNKPFYPLSSMSAPAWAERSEKVVREELKFKVVASFNAQRQLTKYAAKISPCTDSRNSSV
jgi:putative membrane protein